jgi:hypothetical protein
MNENWSHIENSSIIEFEIPRNDRECFLKYHNSSGINDSGKE